MKFVITSKNTTPLYIIKFVVERQTERVPPQYQAAYGKIKINS